MIVAPPKCTLLDVVLATFQWLWQHHDLSNSRVHNSITFEFMTITLETMVVDRLARPWITPQWELTPQCRNRRQRELSGNYESFWNLKVSLNDTSFNNTTPPSPPQIVPPTRTTYPNTWVYLDSAFTSKPPHLYWPVFI